MASNIAQRPDGRYRARYTDQDGKEHAKHFKLKKDATAWLDEKRGELVTGDYIDPDAGKATFKEYAESWRTAQVHRTQTATQIESLLRSHVYPTFGGRQLASIRKSEVQSWAKGLAATLAPSTIALVFRWYSTIFRAAIDDGLIRSTPCRGVKLPKAQHVDVVPLETAQVEAVRDAVAPRWRAAVMLANGAPIPRQRFSRHWRGAADTAGLGSKVGFHALRHYYASLLIRHGESVKVVQSRLGHASAAETLDTYSHLWPDSEDTTRAAVDAVLGASAQTVRENLAD